MGNRYLGVSMSGGEPADLTAALERDPPALPGPGERSRGYTVLGVPFLSGDLLALRRFPSTSSGSACTSVWHRAASGRWTFYADVPADEGCARYFDSGIDELVHAPIRIEWPDLRSLIVSVNGGRTISWSLELASTVATRLFTRLASAMPERSWNDPRVRGVLESLAPILLRTGRLRLSGPTPSGYRFVTTPRAVWAVASSRAMLDGRPLGPMAPLPEQVALAGFWIPRRALFAIGESRIE
jgi:hypothetical protein